MILRRSKLKKSYWMLFFAACIISLTTCIGFDKGMRYWNWKTLTKATLVSKAELFMIERYTGDYACLYAITCHNDRPGLELITDLDSWDLEHTKELVWDRRFSNFCSGLTANFALEFFENNPPEHRKNTREQAIWSFYNNRFFPQSGRFSGGSFSQLPHILCTPETAIVSNPSPKTSIP